MIQLHQKVAGRVLEYLHNVRDNCNINTTEEEKRIIKIRTNFTLINDMDKRNELSDDLTFIADGIRRKLYDCAEVK